MMKRIDYAVGFLLLIITSVGLIWSWESTSLMISNNHNADRHLNFTNEKGRHIYNETSVIENRKKVEKFMKPWQTIQIFRFDVDPMDMRFSRSWKDISNSVRSRQTNGIERRVKSCAVVGNSGILLKSGCGHVIDDMDLVIRMNLAEFGHEYSSDVGSKVTLMTINREQLRQVLACFLNMTQQGKDVHLSQNATTPALSAECGNFVRRLRMINDDVLWLFKGRIPGLQEVLSLLRRNFGLRFKFAYSPIDPVGPSRRLWTQFKSPSTGLAMYTAATQLCDEISLFGFYPFYTDKYNRTVLHHYYEPELKDFVVHHALSGENEAFLDLEKEGALRLINNCTASGIL